MKFVTYVSSALLALTVVNGSVIFDKLFPGTAKHFLLFKADTACRCVEAAELFHQELFDPTLLMFVKSVCPEIKTQVTEKYNSSFFDIHGKWNHAFDRMNPKSWEALINYSFTIISSIDSKLAEDFINEAVLSRRTLLKRVDYKFDIADYGKKGADYEYKIVSYLKAVIFERFVSEVIEILSLPNPEESKVRLIKVIQAARSEINMMTLTADRKLSSLIRISIEKLRSVDFTGKVFEDIHDLVDYILSSITSVDVSNIDSNEFSRIIKNYLPGSSKKTPSRINHVSQLNLENSDEEFGTDYEMHMSYEVGIIRIGMGADEAISEIRRKKLKKDYVINYKVEDQSAILIIDDLSEYLRINNERKYFTFDFGQEKVIDYLSNSSSYQSKLFMDFITLNYYKPHLYDYELTYSMHKHIFDYCHGDLTKTFINSLMYSALIRFNKLFPEHAEIMNNELGLNPQLLDNINPSEFLSRGDDPHHVLIRIAMWDQLETFELFNNYFGPTESLNVIYRLFFKALKRGNQEIVDILIQTYGNNRIEKIAGDILEKAVAKHNEKLIHFIIESGYKLDFKRLMIVGKFAIIYDDQELFQMIYSRFDSVVLINVLVPYAYSLVVDNNNEFVRYLLQTWKNMVTDVSDADRFQANYYASLVNFEGFSGTLESPKVTLKLLAEMSNDSIFKDNLKNIGSAAFEDAFEALKVAKSREIVRTILETFPSITYDSQTAALIIKNLMEEMSKDRSISLSDFLSGNGINLLVEIASKSSEPLSEDDLFAIFVEAGKHEFYLIYKLVRELEIKVSENFIRRLYRLEPYEFFSKMAMVLGMY